MKIIRIIYLRREFLIIGLILIILIIALIAYSFVNMSLFDNYINSYIKVIVIDPGHGGIDGGTSKEGVLEKVINLDISKRIKTYLEPQGYKVILTRETDISLDKLIDTGGSRHQRDLKARAQIINNSNAKLFLSIHGNCHVKNLNASGSIVLYNERFIQNKALAYSIQRALNNITIEGEKRTVHDPQNNSSFYLLNCTKIPGAIVETAFISNTEERQLLLKDMFKDEIAKAITNGIINYFDETKKVLSIEYTN